jgi:hypothetical protein
MDSSRPPGKRIFSLMDECRCPCNDPASDPVWLLRWPGTRLDPTAS